jgi:DNA-binding XRE family transcriptional regulator
MPKDAANYLYDKYIRGNPKREARILKMRNAMRVSEEFYRIRTTKRYSQKRIAKLLECTEDSVARVEWADYTFLKKSLKLLAKAAELLGCDYKLNLLPEEPSK